MSLTEQEHLGGYTPGGDPATYYPELWTWLVEDFGVETVLDVGAGDGVAVNYFLGLGCKAKGVEGVPQKNPDIIRWDYCDGPLDPDPDADFDLVWSCEFVEHIEEAYVNNFLDTFKQGKIVLMTHAFPGQQGFHHVNCQPAWYWIDKMKEIGYKLDTDLTMETREIAAANKNLYNHYVRSGLAFRRNS